MRSQSSRLPGLHCAATFSVTKVATNAERPTRLPGPKASSCIPQRRPKQQSCQLPERPGTLPKVGRGAIVAGTPTRVLMPMAGFFGGALGNRSVSLWRPSDRTTGGQSQPRTEGPRGRTPGRLSRTRRPNERLLPCRLLPRAQLDRPEEGMPCGHVVLPAKPLGARRGMDMCAMRIPTWMKPPPGQTCRGAGSQFWVRHHSRSNMPG